MNKYVIIVAGGVGSRMESVLPKQFVEINGKPILMHTIQAFYNYCKSIKFIIVLPKNQHEYWEKLKTKHNFDIPHHLAEGGSERFYSVKNGLQFVQTNSLVAIHDGVRPLVNKQTISQCFAIAEKKGSAIPTIPASVSLRRVKNGESKSVNRSEYVEVQTPQVFKKEWIIKAYNQNFTNIFTDDASVVEKYGYPITLVQGNTENIKITYPIDLKIAEILLHNL